MSVDLGEWTEEASETGAVLYYGSLEAFVSEYLLALYRRPVSANSATWCAEWWRHPEAIVRLEALWRAWEHLRLDPATGMSVWLRDHADHHMAVLLASDGPFKGCTEKQHSSHPLAPLRSAPAPEGLFDPVCPVGSLRIDVGANR